MHKYFESPEGEVFAYPSDGTQDGLIPKDFKQMSQAEADAFIAKNNPSISDILDSAKNYMRSIRKDTLDAVTGIGFRAVVSGDTALAKEASVISKQLLDITDDADLNSAKTYEEMVSAGMRAYKLIEQNASDSFKSAFAPFVGD